MFPRSLEGWLDQDLSDLPLVIGSESHIAPQRLGGARMDLQGRNRTLLVESVNVHVGILKRGDGTDAQKTKVEIVSPAHKCAPFGSLGATGG